MAGCFRVLARLSAAALVGLCLALAPGSRPAIAQGAGSLGFSLFRIGTGGERGTYFPVGSIIARALSDAGASCAGEARCGVPGLLAVAQLSNGSVANVDAISAGVLEAGLAQADVVYWAFTGTETFAGKSAQKALRVVANLYAESIHVVVSRKRADVQSIDELADRRVSLDEQGSGTLVDARIILSEYGLDERALRPVYIKPQFAAERLSRGVLDAFFIVAGYPTPSVVDLAARASARLLPIEAQRAARIARRYPFFSPDVIPGGVYTGIGETPTVSVGAQLVVSARLDPDFVYTITRALWSERTREMLAKGHAKGAEIRLETALRGVNVPLHEGAERFYREAGMLPAQGDDGRRSAVQPLAGLRP